MKKLQNTLMSLLTGMFVLLAVAIPAEAQDGRRPGGYVVRGGYGPHYRGGYRQPNRGQYGYGNYYYDPAYLEQMFRLPEALMACQLNFETEKYEGCHFLLKTVEYMEGHALRHEDRSEFLGTYHPYTRKDGKKVRHFHAFDDKSPRISKGGKVAIGTGAGATGGAVFGGRKGAVIGAGIGALAGWLAAHKTDNHDKCEEIGKSEPASAIADFEPAVEPNDSHQEPIGQQTTAVPVDPLATITWQTYNNTRFRAMVTDPNLPDDHPKKRRLISVGSSMPLPEPAGDEPYAVVLLEPGRGKSNPVPGEIIPTEDLQGWEIVARK